MRLWILASVLLAASCVHQPKLGEPFTAPSQDYAFVKVGEGYHLFARNSEAYKQGLAQICGKNICSVERAGEVYLVTVTPK